jgi:hypothetical protein
MRESSLRHIEERQKLRAERDEVHRKQAERARERFEKQPVVELAGCRWRRHPDRPELLCSVDNPGHVMSERKLREIQEQREAEARLAEVRRAADRADLEARIRELEQRLATSK